MNPLKFLQAIVLAEIVSGAVWLPARAAEARHRLLPAPADAFQTRGVVLVPEDLSLADWPERAAKAGLTTVGLHHGASPKAVVDFIESPAGRDFLAKCARLGVQVEYELHAMRELLPRALFATEPALFRMNDQGERTPDANRCVHSPRAREVVASNALPLAGPAREVWLVVSRSRPWRRPAVMLRCRRDVVEAEAQAYARPGLPHLSSFAVWLDTDYVKRFCEPEAFQEYGQSLRQPAAVVLES